MRLICTNCQYGEIQFSTRNSVRIAPGLLFLLVVQSGDKRPNDKRPNDKRPNDKRSNDKRPNDKIPNEKISNDKIPNDNRSIWT